MKVSEELLTHILTGGCPTAGGLVTPRQEGPIANSMKEVQHRHYSLFHFAYTETGFNNIVKWFEENSTCSVVEETPVYSFSENQFINFMRELTDHGDYEILEIFDMFDTEDTGSIGFNHFYLIFSLLLARESGQCTQFLYQHGRMMFDIMSDRNSQTLTFEQFARLGFILGISEQHILHSLKEFTLDLFDSFSFEDFLMYYFVILDNLDKGRKPPESTVSAQALKADKKGCIIS